MRLVFSASIVLAACTPGQAPTIPHPQTSAEAKTRPANAGMPSSMVAALMQMKIRLVAQDAHSTLQLVDGKYRSSADLAAPDYADVSILPQPMAYGDLNGDGVADAAILLAENYGGSGVFVSLIAVLDMGGQLVQAGSYFIDDRPKVSAVSIRDGKILVEGDIHGPSDPGCCASFGVLETLDLDASGLTVLNMKSVTPEGAWRSIRIQEPSDGSEADAGSMHVNGSFSIGPFENTLIYRIYDQQRDLLTSGRIAGSGTPGAAGKFDTFLDLSMISHSQLGRLEIADLSTADGSVLATDSIELMIK